VRGKAQKTWVAAQAKLHTLQMLDNAQDVARDFGQPLN
jgi:hypothetical protein